MLVSLSIKNFILVDSISMDFASGLCILSGETGAGKSIILEAISAVLGKRVSAKLIKHKELSSVIAAVFDITVSPWINEFLKANGIESTGSELVLRRTIEPSGRSRCYVNDIIVSLATLETLGAELAEISSQHEGSDLFDHSKHRAMLDAFLELGGKVSTLSLCYERWQEAERAVTDIEARIASSDEEGRYLRHVIDEVAELNPKKHEEVELAEIRDRLRAKAKIQEVLHSVLDEAAPGIITKLHGIIKAISKVPDLFTEAEKSFEAAIIEINEGIACVEKVASLISNETMNLDEVETRLFHMKNIARKHGVSVDELESFLENTKAALVKIGNYDELYNQAKENAKKYKLEYWSLAKEISEARKVGAKVLKEAVCIELAQLKMGYADFMVEVVDLAEEGWSASGINSVRFVARTNPKSLFEPINKIASGGELSRFFLSLRIALARVKSSPTIVFDEVDTGVGGAVADSIGRKLALLAGTHQVLVVTHQPQVASYSNTHYLVYKTASDTSTNVSIKKLGSEEKLREIARMLSAESITDESVSAAAILIQRALECSKIE